MKTITFNITIHHENNDTLQPVKAKRTFSYAGLTFCIHRPWYGFLNNWQGGFCDSSWTVSEKTTGANIGTLRDNRGDSPHTMVIAEERAKMKLSSYSTNELLEKVNSLPKLN